MFKDKAETKFKFYQALQLTSKMSELDEMPPGGDSKNNGIAFFFEYQPKGVDFIIA